VCQGAKCTLMALNTTSHYIFSCDYHQWKIFVFARIMIIPFLMSDERSVNRTRPNTIREYACKSRGQIGDLAITALGIVRLRVGRRYMMVRIYADLSTWRCRRSQYFFFCVIDKSSNLLHREDRYWYTSMAKTSRFALFLAMIMTLSHWFLFKEKQYWENIYN